MTWMKDEKIKINSWQLNLYTKGETYRINNEYLTPTFAYRVPGVKFWVFLVHFKWVDGWCDPDYDTIGQYSSMDELLEKCK